jgi:hypothetical protein
LPPLFNPLQRSQAGTEAYILRQTPPGTHMAEVVEFIEQQGWEIRYVSHNHGFNQPGTGRSVGEQSIRANAGNHRFLSNLVLTRNVTILYGFDENGKLTDVYVWHTIK